MRAVAGRPPSSKTTPWAVARTAAAGSPVSAQSGASKLHFPSLSSCFFPSSRNDGFRARSEFPKRHPFHFAGAKGMSVNTTAPSHASAWAGPPKRCSAETVNAKLEGCNVVSAATLTRICGGANSSTFISRSPRMRPSFPGILARSVHFPLGCSAGTLNACEKTVPAASVVSVRCE